MKKNEDSYLRNSPRLVSDELNGNFKPLKILANFVLNPESTVYIIFILSEENRKIIFNNKILEGAVGSYTNNLQYNQDFYNIGKSLIYFVIPQ